MSIPNSPGRKLLLVPTRQKQSFALPRALLCISLGRAYISLHMLTDMQQMQSTALKGIVFRPVIRHMHAWPTYGAPGYRHQSTYGTCWVCTSTSTYVPTQPTSTEHISKDRDANQIMMHCILHACTPYSRERTRCKWGDKYNENVFCPPGGFRESRERGK